VLCWFRAERSQVVAGRPPTIVDDRCAVNWMCVWWALFSGGPGGGKSTLVGFLSQGFREAGVRCVVVREAATAALLDGDVSALGVEGRQRAILRRSLLEQELALALARQHALHGPVFVFQDRGPLDGRAYCDPDVFAVVAATEDFDVAGALDHVDAIFHVSTAPSEAYVGPCDIARLGYNPARRECYAEAAKACELHAREYQSHAGYARIENGADAMRGKLVAVLAMIEAQVTEPLRVAVSKAAALALRAYDVSKQTVQPCPTYTVLDRLVRLQFEALTTPREALFPVFGHSATHLAGKLRLYDSNMLTLWSTLDMGNRARLCQHLGRYCARTVNGPSGGDAMGTAVSSSRRASLVREAYDRWASMSRSAPTSLAIGNDLEEGEAG
jgi:predicted ATPase